MAISEHSNDKTPAVRGENTADGAGVVGLSKTWQGVHGSSEIRTGVLGQSKSGRGMHGISDTGTGVNGVSKTGSGVHGTSDSGTGVAGASKSWQGVHGVSETRSGVLGESQSGRGVHGVSVSSTGVNGVSQDGRGLHGTSANGTGVHGESSAGIGVHGKGGRFAGYFEGTVQIDGDLAVTRDIRLVGADLAEQFDVVGQRAAPPGTVVVLAGHDRVRVSDTPYDTRVAGVVSGAGSYRPALVMDSHPGAARAPLALTGKVWVFVDADEMEIQCGDLLTTSSTPGHAMRVADHSRALGAILGKALDGLPVGRGMIRALVSLQ